MPSCRHIHGLALAIALSACNLPEQTPLPDGGSSGGGTTGGCTSDETPFIASTSDFNGFMSWTSFDLGSDAGGDGLGDVGDRVVYINHLPPSGSTSFPPRTILVKTAGFGTPDAGPTFAMVKAGGCYNSGGAVGWEWYEIQPLPSGSVEILWGGIQQPAADVYGTSGVSCNACHASSAKNDYVAAPQLELSGL